MNEDNSITSEDKPVTCAYTGRTLKPGQNILEVREVLVNQEGTGAVSLPGSLFFSDWKALLEYAAESQTTLSIKRRVP